MPKTANNVRAQVFSEPEAVSYQDFKDNAKQYINKFSVCYECGRHFCVGFDTVAVYCEDCYFSNSCLKRFDENAKPPIVTICQQCAIPEQLYVVKKKKPLITVAQTSKRQKRFAKRMRRTREIIKKTKSNVVLFKKASTFSRKKKHAKSRVRKGSERRDVCKFWKLKFTCPLMS